MSSSPFQYFADFKLLCEQIAHKERHQIVVSNPIWIFGAGQFGRDVCSILLKEGFQVLGFIESKPREDKVLGLPVITWDQLKADQLSAQLAIGIFNRGMPLDKLKDLAVTAGFTEVFMPWDVYTQFSSQLGWRYWLSSPRVILDNLPAIEQTYQNLADETSRQCLLDLCAFRLGMNDAYASFSHADHQYFNGLTLSKLPSKKLTYVDCGAYNGDTFFEFVSKVEVANAYLFEPDPDNFKLLTEAVKKSSTSAVCMPLAVADRYRILSFNSGNGEGGAISDTGTVHIAAVALDEVLPGQDVDFLKLDVEGAEIAAIQGGALLIKRSRPVLAISLYHRPQDVWEILEQLMRVCENYQFYIRQHYSNSFDSVLYAIPIL